VQGVFSDSERKSMQAMLARVTEPVAYQAFQHFITHAPWNADRVWRRLRAVVPERQGALILDSTSFPISRWSRLYRPSSFLATLMVTQPQTAVNYRGQKQKKA